MTPRVRFASDMTSTPSLYSVASTSRHPRHLPQTPYPTTRSYTTIRDSSSSLEQISSTPPATLEAHHHEITLLDHRIAEQGGTTSAIARLPHRIQKTKGRISDKDRIEELTRDYEAQLEENNHLKRVNYELNRFREQVVVGFQGLRNALHELSTRVTLSEQELSKYWGFELDNTADDDMPVI
ncbi:hypothetical protein GJ744_005236 [Endocarpon pusillum]|uniref:Uncharacterized protein n=1 Tax=Endocarpon pusillum TaxID=364733 RepID=A0A8H7A521_9EURO|nr:hypothetical protein GJ744_005236 [Endocarpon pusillum]